MIPNTGGPVFVIDPEELQNKEKTTTQVSRVVTKAIKNIYFKNQNTHKRDMTITLSNENKRTSHFRIENQEHNILTSTFWKNCKSSSGHQDLT